ncbi:MAG TPA: cytochrome c [Hyphomicrobiaceae bacterium]|jgi:cytochrome c556|nr:cytochrome c [Hyphomicrobiaceae bacterium]
MIRILSVAAAIAVSATVVYAGADFIDQRQRAMKALANAAKAPGAVLKGEAKFELDKVHSSLAVFKEQAAKLKDLWPDDSKDGETNALPAVWDKKSEFLALFDKFEADVQTASEKIKDEDSFKAEWPKVMSNCGGCHKQYRKPQ